MRRSGIRGIVSIRVGCEGGAVCSRVSRTHLRERVTSKHGCEGGEPCQDSENCNNHSNHKSEHLPRTDAIGKQPQKGLTLECEQRSQLCRPKPHVTQSKKELTFPGSTPHSFPLPKNKEFVLDW